MEHNEFKERNTKVIALSVDSVEDHLGWAKDVEAYGGEGCKVTYPIIADKDRKIAHLYNMLPVDDQPGMPMTVRSVFIIGPDRKAKLIFTYPPSTGRNFVEILRVLDSLQLTAGQSLATPANWVKGEKCVILPSVNAEDAAAKFPGFETLELPSGKAYLRMTDHK
jgi:alkyl hydroperoxide reductase subunit AhpC